MSNPPHVVLVVLDTVRADAAGLGNPTPSAMPRLQDYVRDGTVWLDTYSSSPWTLPAHASLLTGAYVWRHGCDERHLRLGPELPTLAEQLRTAGYATGAVSGNSWIGPDFGLDRGFDRFLRAWRPLDRGADLNAIHRTGRAMGRTDLREALRRASGGGLLPALVNTAHHLLVRRRGRFGGARVAKRAVGLAAELARSGRPVFLFVNFLDAHLRYWPPRRYRRAMLGPDARKARRVNQDPWAFLSGRVAMTDDDLRLLRSLYLAELARLDEIFAYFLAGLERILDPDRTLVVITSDHGEHLGEHGLMDHQYSLGDALLRVPLALRGPGAGVSGTHPGLRQIVDIAPTLLEVAGVGTPHGSGFGQLLTSPPRTWALAEYLAPQPSMAAMARHGYAEMLTRFDRGLRSMVLSDGRKIVCESNGSLALYNLSADPGELYDLAAERPEEARALARELAQLGAGGTGT